jgi:hypothetical protein
MVRSVVVWVRVCLVILGLLPSVARPATPEREVLALLLPTQRLDAELVSQRVIQIARLVAARLSVPPVRAEDLRPRIDHSARLREAHALAIDGSLDEAALILDVVLEDEARNPHRLAAPREFLAGHLWRIAIALARQERARTSELVRRLLRYDPDVRVESAEESPQLRQLLAEAKRVGPMTPGADDLGEACHEFEVVIAGRVQERPEIAADARGLELFRFDRCRLVARALATGRNGDVVIAALAAPALPPRALSPAYRRERTLGLVTGALGLTLLAAGTYFAVEASGQADDIARGCTTVAPCPGGLVRQRASDIDSSTLSARILWATGGAALVTSVVLYWMSGRQEEGSKTTYSVSLTPQGAGLAWIGAF